MDKCDAETRRRIMTSVRGKNTGPELLLRKALHRLGYRYRLHSSALPGKPDIVLPKYRTVVFVHGCFWHRHSNCRLASTPQVRVEWWKKKFAENVERDRRKENAIRTMGWKCVVIWQCQIEKSLEAAVREVQKAIKSRRA